jgi:hypothetical protein
MRAPGKIKLDVRRLGVLGALLLGGCGQPAHFAPGQVWSLENPLYPNARVIVGAVDSRGDRLVVHVSIVGLELPPGGLGKAAADLGRVAALLDPIPSSACAPPGPLPRSFAILSDGDDVWGWRSADDGERSFERSSIEDYSSGEARIDFEAGMQAAIVVLPDVPIYDTVLRAGLGKLVGKGAAPDRELARHHDFWRSEDERLPDFFDEELERSLDKIIEISVASVATGWLPADTPAPPPADEAPVKDALAPPCSEAPDPSLADPRYADDLRRLKEGSLSRGPSR